MASVMSVKESSTPARSRFLRDWKRRCGSFARGLPFQENPRTGDCRISGTCASLAGLEKAIREETDREVDLALRRILLIHGITLLIGGIPLIYLGDEIATLNDYSYRDLPSRRNDSRWVHRPEADSGAYERRRDESSVEGRLYAGLQRLIGLRKANPVFSGHNFQVIDSEDPHVFAFARTYQGQRAMVFANFAEDEVVIPGNLLRLYGLGYKFQDLVQGGEVGLEDIHLDPYQLAVFCSE